MTPGKVQSKSPRQTSLFTTAKKKELKKNSVKPAKATSSPQPIPRPPGKKIWLSATSLENMRRCPRCFWLQVHLKIYQPEGIVSRLANRFDGVIKKYFELYRGTSDLPPLVAGQIGGQLESPFQETYFVTINDKFGYMGKLDECVIDSAGQYVPVDFKTASSDPTKRELIPAYQFQLDSYAFLLQQNRKPPSGVGHLIYFYPAEGNELHQGFPMHVTVKTLQTHPDQVPGRIDQAIKLLAQPLPVPSDTCNFCTYVETVKSF